jgi:hypothetical protein
MQKIHVITPVKDSIELSLQTIQSVCCSQCSLSFSYTVYNDFSTEENTERLQKASQEFGFELVNLAEITNTPSPNYLLVLQIAQQKAIDDNAALVIVESDVLVQATTLQSLIDIAQQRTDAGMVASITVDERGDVNYPYLFAKKLKGVVKSTNKHVSFCCTLLSLPYLQAYSFTTLQPDKNWYDVHISRQSRQLGFVNYLVGNHTVVHRPHSSRPWKQLKYSNPIKYYWLKITQQKDKI